MNCWPGCGQRWATTWRRLPGLDVVGDPAIRVASPDPRQAAADLAARTGHPAYEAERGHLNAIGHGVRLDGYAVEFVGSASGSAHDLVGGFLADRGPGVFATTFRVRDVSAARSALAGAASASPSGAAARS